LKTPVPLPKNVIDCFVALVDSPDQELAKQSVQSFYTVMNQTPINKDSGTPLVMTVTAVFGEILKTENIKQLVRSAYAALFCSLMMRIGTAQGVDKGESSKDAVHSLKVFLEAMSEDVILAEMKEKKIWETLKKAKYDDGVTKLTAVFCQEHQKAKRALLKFLSNFYSQQSFTGQRIVATTMLAEFVNHSADDGLLLKELIKFLLPRVVDKVEKVRKQALRGLGNLVSVWTDEVSSQASAILSALVTASEDKNAEVAAEAVASLTRIARVVNEETISPMLINICFRMRPAFDRKDPEIRKAAFTLFGELSRFGSEQVQEGGLDGLKNNFIDQIHGNLPIFIVHLVDEDKEARDACAEAFKKFGSLMDTEMNECINQSPSDENQFDEWANRIAPLMVKNYGDRLRGYMDTTQTYFDSKWNAIRAAACILAGEMLAATSPEDRRIINTKVIIEGLIKLLKAPTDTLRSKAAKSLSLLHHV